MWLVFRYDLQQGSYGYSSSVLCSEFVSHSHKKKMVSVG